MGKIIKTYRLFIVALLFPFIFISCDDEGCIESVVSYTAGAIIAEQDESVQINSFSVWGVGQENDSVLINRQTSLTGIELLLNPNAESTDFRFEFYTSTDTIMENITFNYKNNIYFLSEDCGCSTFYTLESIKSEGSFIIKTQILNPEVTNETQLNFNLFS